jgi:predicted transcriptional regulator
MLQAPVNHADVRELAAPEAVPDVAAVRELFPREREIASVVYALGSATATQVQERLVVPLSNAAARSMLNRLVAKAVLRRDANWGGHGKQFVYSPAITVLDERREALQQFVEDYFGGSVSRAALSVFEMLSTEYDAQRCRVEVQPLPRPAGNRRTAAAR